MRRLVPSLVAAAALTVGLFAVSPVAKSETGPFDFDLHVIGSGAAGSTMTFVVSGAASDVRYLIFGSPNQNGTVIDPFATPLGDVPPFSLCIGRPMAFVAAGNTDDAGYAISTRRVPPSLRPQAAGRVFYFQAFYTGFNGRTPKGFVSDVESSLIHY